MKIVETLGLFFIFKYEKLQHTKGTIFVNEERGFTGSKRLDTVKNRLNQNFDETLMITTK